MLTFLYPPPYQLSLQCHAELQFNLLSDLEGRKYIKKIKRNNKKTAGKARVLFFVKRLMFLNSQETLLAIVTTFFFFFFKLKNCDLGETQGKHFSSFSSQNRGRNKAEESVDE